MRTRLLPGRRARMAAILAFAGATLLAFAASPAFADPCPQSDTCPSQLQVIVQGPKAVELKWIEPEGAITGFLITGAPPLPNQPIPVTTGNPDDWQDHNVYGLNPSTQYVFTVCSQPDNSCVSSQRVTTPSQGAASSTPTPTITSVSETPSTISLQWSSPVSYVYYNVRWTGLRPIGGLTAQQSPELHSTSWTSPPLYAGETYDVRVQGCLGDNTCSSYADTNATTKPCPPGTTWLQGAGTCGVIAVACGSASTPCQGLPPQDLRLAIKTPGPIVLSWALPPPSLAPPQDVQKVTVSRNPTWPNGFTTTTLPAPNATSYVDVLAASGISYSYTVCIVYASPQNQFQIVWQPNPACGSVSGEVPAPPAPFHPPKFGPAHIIATPSQGQSSPPERLGGGRPGGAILQPSDACRPGFVWRMANPTDHICVTPQKRAQVAAGNAASRQSEVRAGNAAPACQKGYVWRPDGKACVKAPAR
jgi:hypothetical protein